MNRLQKYLSRKAAIVKEMDGLLSHAESEGRELNEAEKLGYGKLEAELGTPRDGDKSATGIYADIEREEKLQAHQRTAASIVNPGSAPTETLSGDAKKIRIEGIHTKPTYFKSAEDAYLSGRYLRAALTKNPDDIQWCREHGVNMLAASGAHSSTNNAASGVFVPEPMLNTIIELREQYGSLRPNAMRVTMTSDTLSIPRWVSGLTVYYPGENTDITTSKTSHNMVSLTARKYAALAVYPVELVNDAVISFADLFAHEVAEAFAKAEDTNGFLGDGTSTYGGTTGILTKLNDGSHAASIYTAATGNTSFDTLDLSDFTNMQAKLPKYARANAKWYISAAGYDASMSRLKYSGGGNDANALAGSSGLSFLGSPVELVQVLNSTLTTQTSTALFVYGDLSKGVMIGDRMAVSIAADSSRYFEADQIAMKATQRIDINPHSLGDSSTAGPVILMKTPGS